MLYNDWTNETVNKTESLEQLKGRLEGDNSLPLKEANLVFGEGSHDSRVIFIGEAPGFYENLQGRPFVGRAGKLLDELINGVGWKREDVYITNIIKRRPPENRDPLPEEITAYAPYLDEQIEIINPKIIATLGRFSMNYFLPQAQISKNQGEVLRLGNRLVVPLYHPAAALRSTAVLQKLREAFAGLPSVLEKYDELINTLEDKKSLEIKKEGQTALF